VQQLDEAMEGLEDLLFDERPHGAEVQRRSFELRKSLVVLRRVVLPMREVVNSLLRRDLKLVDEAMGPYFQDVYDHVLRATEWTESLRDLVSTILETNLTIQDNRLNSIMKKVTSWAAIIAVPTAVTGFYGMNVPTPASPSIPGSSPQWCWWWSCPAACTCSSNASTGSEPVGPANCRQLRGSWSLHSRPAAGRMQLASEASAYDRQYRRGWPGV
jgi:Mg2+ and Co2+ transporter CorA